MTNNDGHFAPEIAVRIREVGKYELENQIKLYIKWFNQHGVMDKRGYNAAVIMVGLDLISSLLELKHSDVKDWLAKQIRSTGTLSDGERAYHKLLNVIDISIESYRNIYDRDNKYIASFGYDVNRRKVINFPIQTLSKYGIQENFNPAILIDWMYKHGKAYTKYDENNSPQLIDVENSDASAKVVQVYYEWSGAQTTNELNHRVYKLVNETEVIDV